MSEFNPKLVTNRNSWIKDRPDHRDFLYGAQNKVRGTFFGRYSKVVDLRPQLSRVENQLNMNSCTANAIACAIEMNNGLTDVSRMYMYYNARKLSNLQKQDIGAYFRDALKAAADGTCTEPIWPYHIENLFKEPGGEAVKSATHRIKSYQKLSTNAAIKRNEIMHALDRGRIIVFGTTLFKSFEITGEVYNGPMSQSEKVIGYHAMALVGYDRKENMALLRNSWGEGWGKDGYVWSPMKYITDTRYNDDFWVIEA